MVTSYANQGTFSSRKLKGVKPKDNFIQNKYDFNIKTDYLPPQADIRPCVMPSSETSLKKLRTKRRRIRNHFNGIDHISHVAITVSWKVCKKNVLVAVQFKVS